MDAEVWEAVQERLRANRIARVNGDFAEAPSLLAGVLYDDSGDRMSPTHARKGGKRYRYYVSQPLIKGHRGTSPLGRRVPAGELESLVENRLTAFLNAESEVYAAIESEVSGAIEPSGLIAQAAETARSWLALPPAERRGILLSLGVRVDIRRESVEIQVTGRGVLSFLRGEKSGQNKFDAEESPPRTITWSIPVRLRRTGIEKRLLLDGADSTERRAPDHSLARLIARAHQYQGMLMRSDGKTITQLAKDAGVTGSYFTRVLRLSFLAPDIVKAILANRHPIELSAKRLVNEARLPIGWQEQKALFGFGQHPIR